MQNTYDFWKYVVRDTYRESLESFLRLFDVLYAYHVGLGEDDSLKSFRKNINEIVIHEVISEIDKDSEIWKMIEDRLV
jgi:uncharacterized radical SAM superfamily protein